MPKRQTVKSDGEDRNQAQGIPEDAGFVCAYSVSVQNVIDCELAVFYRECGDQDELWIVDANSEDFSFPPSVIQALSRGEVGPAQFSRLPGVTVKRAVVATDELEPADSYAQLLFRYIRSKIMFEWPGDFVAGGILQEADWRQVVDEVYNELRRNREKAKKQQAEIIRVARELELNPRPSGLAPDSWIANCPRSNLILFISAEDNSFACPWFKAKGGPEELRAFVAEFAELRRQQSLGHGRMATVPPAS